MSMSSVPWTRSLGLSAIKILPPDKQEENTPLIPFVKRRTTTVFTLRDTSKGDDHSLHYGLNAPPRASQAFVPGVARGNPSMF
jgi:hypothetical protein